MRIQLTVSDVGCELFIDFIMDDKLKSSFRSFGTVDAQQLQEILLAVQHTINNQMDKLQKKISEPPAD